MPAGLVSATIGTPPASSRAVTGGSIPEPGKASAVAVLGLQVPVRVTAPASGHQSTSLGRLVPKMAQGLAKATLPAFAPHVSRPHFG